MMKYVEYALTWPVGLCFIHVALTAFALSIMVAHL